MQLAEIEWKIAALSTSDLNLGSLLDRKRELEGQIETVKGEESRDQDGVTKVTVHLLDEYVDELKRMAELRGVTVKDVLIQAIADEKFIDDAHRAGNRILLETREGVHEVRFRNLCWPPADSG